MVRRLIPKPAPGVVVKNTQRPASRPGSRPAHFALPVVALGILNRVQLAAVGHQLGETEGRMGVATRWGGMAEARRVAWAETMR